MRKIYITFGGQAYDETTAIIVRDGPKFGADEVWVYDDFWITEHPFYKQNKWLWEHPHKRGFGWMSWKPLIIWDALLRVEDGDIVMFTDADCVPITDFSVLYDICHKDGGIMLFAAQGQRHYKWCKRDCYLVMAQDDEKYRDVQAGVARFMLFQKGHWRTTQFLMEWMTYCVNPRATTFDPSILGEELPGFIEHRAEQAIMTNLAHKYGLKLYREADDSGAQYEEDKDLYPPLFQQINPQEGSAEKVTATVNQGSRFRNV